MVLFSVLNTRNTPRRGRVFSVLKKGKVLNLLVLFSVLNYTGWSLIGPELDRECPEVARRTANVLRAFFELDGLVLNYSK